MTYKVYLRFFGGNNNIIDFKCSSPQTKDIYLDEENKQFVAEYKRKNKCELNLNVILENNSKPGWYIDLTDAQVKNLMPKEDVRDKAKLKSIAKKIIEDFDKEHKNSEFEYYDFMKIGKWVHKNIKYNLSYVGRYELTALDIYRIKTGVCSHYARLSNALLYSLDYPVAYILGYAAEDNGVMNEDDGHAWSIIRLGNKWYPFDSCWGLFKGKVPITHIFSNIDLKGPYTYNYSFSGYVDISTKAIIHGKLMEK